MLSSVTLMSLIISGVTSPVNVGVGVVDRGGLWCLEVGDVAREPILDPGTEAEKNFLEVPNTGLRVFDIA